MIPNDNQFHLLQDSKNSKKSSSKNTVKVKINVTINIRINPNSKYIVSNVAKNVIDHDNKLINPGTNHNATNALWNFIDTKDQDPIDTGVKNETNFLETHPQHIEKKALSFVNAKMGAYDGED